MLAEFIKLPKEGDTVGPYLLKKRLSMSILGSFYTAVHMGLHEEFLIHIMPEALIRADPGFQERYKAEISKQKVFPDGPAMAASDVKLISGNLVVQYGKGRFRSLNEVIINRKEPLPEDRIQSMLEAISSGLLEAAKVQQGHFFLSPDFLFLNENDELRIAGIGIFQSIQYEAFERFVSGALVPVMVDKAKSFSAVEILSPEIRNLKTRDQRSDFYGLGMCAYFMLTGNKPARRLELPSALRDDIHPGWDLLVSQCLDPKPENRFPHFRAFTRSLQHLDELKGTPNRTSGVPAESFLEKVRGPSGLRSKSVRRLFLLGIFGIIMVGLGTVLYRFIFLDSEPGSAMPSIQRVTSPEEANIILKIVPDNSIVEISGRMSGRFLVPADSLYLKGRSGNYRARLSAPRRQPQTIEFDLEASNPIQRVIYLDYDFSSIYARGAIGTEVYVQQPDGLLLYIGTIDDSDGALLDDRLLGGSYQFVGFHENFYPAQTGFIDVGESSDISFSQVPRPTSLRITTAPAGAEVYLNGTFAGETPFATEGLEPDRRIRLRIEREGFRPVDRLLEFDPGEQMVLDFGPLEMLMGTLEYSLQLSVPDPPDYHELAFSIDGELKKIEDSDRLTLSTGPHQIRLEHPDFFPFEQTVEVKDGETTSIRIDLVARPVRLVPILDTDRPYRFVVDGEEVPLTEQGFVPVPPYKSSTVEAVIRDYLSVIQTFQGLPNERIEWQIPLKPIPGPDFGEDWNPPYFDLPMIWLSPGRYSMGSPMDEHRRLPTEDNLTSVRFLKGRWMSAHEIDQKTYFQIIGENPSRFIGDDRPVDSVSWQEAVEFCRRLTLFEEQAGRLPEDYVYRLPTEAEWEYAARAGTETPFSFGEQADPSMGNFQGYYSPDETAGRSPEGRYGTLPTGSFAPNPWGLTDVHGNVAEWTLDRFWDRHPGGSVVNPINTERGRGHTIRGGSWEDSADRVRSAAREGLADSAKRNSVGFRVILGPRF